MESLFSFLRRKIAEWRSRPETVRIGFYTFPMSHFTGEEDE